MNQPCSPVRNTRRLALCLARPFTFVAALACLGGTAAAQPQGILPNSGFEAGLEGWVLRPGDPAQVSLVDQADCGKVLTLDPQGKILVVETQRLAIGKELESGRAYRVEAHLRHEGMEKGVFAFSMYCFDEQGKSLQQIVFYGLNTNSPPHDWRRLRGEFGPGTRNPLPEGTRSVAIRFSFYEGQGDCRGKVSIDDVVLQPYEPPGYADWPAEIVADLGELQIRLESRSFWTLYRIDYRGTRLCLDRWGSHYGSVASFPDSGFIGSGHTEHEDEQILKLTLWIDDKPIEKPEPAVRCRSIRLEKRSRIRNLVLDTRIDVRDNRILEDVRLEAEKPTAVKLVYHFMHPWTDTATEYVAELLDGSRVEGEFNGDKSQKIDKATRWSAIYDGPSGKGAVTCVVEAPSDDDWRTRYWDVPDRYRKHYLATFLNKTIPADKQYRYRAIIVPFEAAQGEWKSKAAGVAEICKGAVANRP